MPPSAGRHDAFESGTPVWLAQCETDVPDGDGWLTPWERQRISGMRYTKRRDESRTVRWAIKKTIAGALGAQPRSNEDFRRFGVVNLPSGAPVVDVEGADDLSISMTDRAGWAVGLVRKGTEPIGCDLELVEPRSEAFVADYFTPTEQSAVHREVLPATVLANLIWSAKESALKVLRTGLRRDTRSVEVTVTPGAPGTWAPLVVELVEGGTLPGWWIRLGPFLLTMASSAESPPPISLVEPSPLARAQPIHSWMTRPMVDGAPRQ